MKTETRYINRPVQSGLFSHIRHHVIFFRAMLFFYQSKYYSFTYTRQCNFLKISKEQFSRASSDGVNRPLTIYQYSSMTPRLSGQNRKFFKFLLPLNFQKRLGYHEETTQNINVCPESLEAMFEH